MDPEIKINELRRKKIITIKVSQRFFYCERLLCNFCPFCSNLKRAVFEKPI